MSSYNASQRGFCERVSLVKIEIGGNPPVKINFGGDDSLVIGRAARLAYQITGDTEVSHVHCELSLNGGKVFIRDLNSTNGTFLNGADIGRETRRIGPGDMVRVGKTLINFHS